MIPVALAAGLGGEIEPALDVLVGQLGAVEVPAGDVLRETPRIQGDRAAGGDAAAEGVKSGPGQRKRAAGPGKLAGRVAESGVAERTARNGERTLGCGFGGGSLQTEPGRHRSFQRAVGGEGGRIGAGDRRFDLAAAAEVPDSLRGQIGRPLFRLQVEGDVRVVREIELSVDLLEFIAAVGSGDGDRGVGDLDPAPEQGGRRGRIGGGAAQGFGYIPALLPIPVQLQRQAFEADAADAADIQAAAQDVAQIEPDRQFAGGGDQGAGFVMDRHLLGGQVAGQRKVDFAQRQGSIDGFAGCLQDQLPGDSGQGGAAEVPESQAGGDQRDRADEDEFGAAFHGRSTSFPYAGGLRWAAASMSARETSGL